jgi:hypothetical protein
LRLRQASGYVGVEDLTSINKTLQEAPPGASNAVKNGVTGARPPTAPAATPPGVQPPAAATTAPAATPEVKKPVSPGKAVPKKKRRAQR